MAPCSTWALVKGTPLPPATLLKGTKIRTCTNVEECREMASRLLDSSSPAGSSSNNSKEGVSVAPRGTRYRDITNSHGNAVCKKGDSVQIRYKVLKLGKRSYDGLSGEGTVVFSRGYGLEEDEGEEDKFNGRNLFSFTIGDSNVISALNDALPGLAVRGTRRISVLPQMGWEKPSKICDGGPGGSGAGGDLKTDYVVVPTATMVATEICFDKDKKPFPLAYAQKRRMAQRFDQSLLMEVELVSILLSDN